MPNSYLYHTQYIQLDPTTWCATAHVSAPIDLRLWDKLPLTLRSNTLCNYPTNFSDLNWQHYIHKNYSSVQKYAQKQRQQQRMGVRRLLKELLTKLEIDDTLNEAQFPYRLINSEYYVCFSHSSNGGASDDYLNTNTKVAVVISHRRTAGIDIETNNVDWHVAQRFYHSNEIAILQTLPTNQRDTATKLLWQIKESFIKINHYKLAQGLGMNYEHLISNIVTNLEKDSSSLSIAGNDEYNYQITFLLSHQTVVIF